MTLSHSYQGVLHMTQHLFAMADCNGDGQVRCRRLHLALQPAFCLTRVSLEEFRAFCAFFFLLQRHQAEAAADAGASQGRGVTAPMLKLIFSAADVGSGGGTCDQVSCDLIGDGRLGKWELRNMLLVLIKESGSLAWLQPKYRADARFKHMLADYCKSPLQWTADAALHELIAFDTPPAIAAAPNVFTDTTRLTWDGLSVIMETKRRSGGETTIEVLTRRWMEAAIEEISHAAPAAHAVLDAAAWEQQAWADGTESELDEDEECEPIAEAAPPAASVSASASLHPPSGARAAAAHGFHAVPGFPLPLGLAPAGTAAAGVRAGPRLRVNAPAATRFVRRARARTAALSHVTRRRRNSLRKDQVYDDPP